MASFSTPAVLLRRIDFGDYDVIVTLFSLHKGKISAIAKAAKKSARRFAGVLELFSALNVVCSSGRRKGLCVLQEAVLTHPFSGIRADIGKTAYASHWAEMVHEWMESDEKQPDLYHLLLYVLTELDSGQTPGAVLSILFQMRFLALSGYDPNLDACAACRKELESLPERDVRFDLKRGAIVCQRCAGSATDLPVLQKGTIKQLRWIKSGGIEKAARIRSTTPSTQEALQLLESFGPYHLGKKLKSLTFLQRIREETAGYGK